MEKVKLLFCAVIAEMDLAIMNLINVFFIGRGIGAGGVASYGIVIPCAMVEGAVIALGYNGLQAVCSKDYGAKNFADFQRHKNAGYSWTIFSLALLTVILAAFRTPMLDFLGANEGGAELALQSKECYTAFLACFVLQGMFAIGSCMLFFEEKRRLITANIVLYVFMISANLFVTNNCPSIGNFVFANVIGELAADFYIFVICFARDKKSLARITAFRLKLSDIKDIFFTGLPDFMEYIFGALLFLAQNLYMLYRFSESVVAGTGIFESVENIPEMFCVGFCFFATNAFGLSVGQIRGAGSKEERLEGEKALHRSAKEITVVGFAFAAVVSIPLLIFARPLVAGFLSDGSDGVAVHSAMLMTIAYAIGFVFYILNNELVCYYKVIGAYHLAHIIFFVEVLAFPLAAKILLGELFGLTGFCFAGIAGEVLAFLLNLCFIRKASGKIMNIT